MRIDKYLATAHISNLELALSRLGINTTLSFEDINETIMDSIRTRINQEASSKGIQLSQEDISRIIRGPITQGSISDRVWYNQSQVMNKLSELVQRAVINNLKLEDLATEFNKIFESSWYATIRLLRTELARVQTEVQRLYYERNGIEKYIYIAINDDRTCRDCAVLNGTLHLVKDMEIGENAPPTHPNCRCTTIPYIEGEETE